MDLSYDAYAYASRRTGTPALRRMRTRRIFGWSDERWVTCGPHLNRSNNPLPFILMTTDSITTTIGTNDIGYFVGDGDCRIQFTEDQMNSLFIGQLYSRQLADSFVNYCKMTVASGSIPSCCRQDLSPQELQAFQDRLSKFQEHFPDALFNLMLIFEYQSESIESLSNF